jgi:pyruvate dehydrogenase E2 component (dihydrolipoamide acetyltransferase)
LTEFKLPELGENVHQGDLVRLMVAPGANVAEGQPVMELETDKAVVEVPSSVTGKVKDVLVKQGEKIKVGQVIFTVENGTGGKRAEAKVSAPAQAKAEARSENPATVSAPSAVSDTQRQTPAKVAAPAAPIVPSETSEMAEFKLPELGENIHQGDLVRLMISPGSQVAEGQPVIKRERNKENKEQSNSKILKHIQL